MPTVRDRDGVCAGAAREAAARRLLDDCVAVAALIERLAAAPDGPPRAQAMIGGLHLVRSPMSQTLYDIPLRRIDGSAETLAASRGKVLLIVNVASRCGLTPQYEGLERLYRAHRDAGLDVLGFPANDFAGQEPGSDEEIAQFCSTSFDVSFPLYAKTSVVGAGAHRLYRHLIAERPDAIGEGPMRQRLADYGIAPNPPPQVLWNFEKFLVGRDGRVLSRFAPDVAADDPRLTEAVERALAASG